jgi:hypothetical protein
MATVKIDFNAWISGLRSLPDDQKYAVLAIAVGVILVVIAIIIW